MYAHLCVNKIGQTRKTKKVYLKKCKENGEVKRKQWNSNIF